MNMYNEICQRPQFDLDQFIYLGCSISSTERNFNMFQGKAWTAIDRITTIWKSDLPEKIKVVAISVLLYGCMLFSTNPGSNTWQKNILVVRISETKLDDYFWHMTYQSKGCRYNNKNEDNSLKTLNDKKKHLNNL